MTTEAENRAESIAAGRKVLDAADRHDGHLHGVVIAYVGAIAGESPGISLVALAQDVDEVIYVGLDDEDILRLLHYMVSMAPGLLPTEGPVQ